MTLCRRAAALLVILILGCSAKQPTEPIQVAHLLPLTGPDKKAAEAARHGLMLAVEEINADDQRIAGRTVVVRNVDSQGDPEQVQREAVRLVTLNKVVAFISDPDSRCAESLARSAREYNIPLIVPGDFPPGTGLDGFRSLNAAPSLRGEVLAR